MKLFLHRQIFQLIDNGCLEFFGEEADGDGKRSVLLEFVEELSAAVLGEKILLNLSVRKLFKGYLGILEPFGRCGTKGGLDAVLAVTAEGNAVSVDGQFEGLVGRGCLGETAGGGARLPERAPGPSP